MAPILPPQFVLFFVERHFEPCIGRDAPVTFFGSVPACGGCSSRWGASKWLW